jgi:nucleoside-diphosphate-sugar epimerase
VLTEEIVFELLAEATRVLVTLPPDGVTDALINRALTRAAPKRVVYLSTTGVYGNATRIDEHTPAAPDTARAKLRFAAEELYRANGAAILRCPAIYGPDRGLHVRVREGKHRIPGDGTQHVSRIHVEDLVSFILAAKEGTFVVGDRDPASHLEVVRFICEKYGVPLPPFAPLSDVDETLRHDRQVDPSYALATLGVTLKYPSYRDGM